MLKEIYKFLSTKFQTLHLEYKVDMKPRYGHGKPPHAGLNKEIASRRGDYDAFLNDLLAFKEHFHAIRKQGEETDPSRPTWNNGYLPGLDVMALYGMVVLNRPSKYIEVGSGNSTKVTYKAKLDHGLKTQITSIDPYPRAEIDGLADTVIRKPFEDVDHKLIHTLEKDDILFIDNSHRILPNSDAMVFFMEILPELKPGVIVHLHDIYLPYDYPQFMCDRTYNEQYGLAMFIMANPNRYTTILPNYFISEDLELSRIIAPLWEHENLRGVEKHGGSFWLRIMK